MDDKDLFISSYLKGKIIDKKSGNSGTVYITDLADGDNSLSSPRYIAYKSIKGEFDEEKLTHFVREARTFLCASGHPLLARAFYISYYKKTPFICMPRYEMDLQEYLNKKVPLSLIESLVFASQILLGLIILNEKKISHHQDLKPANIVIDDLSKRYSGFPPTDIDNSLKYKLMIADFGLANLFKELGATVNGGGTFPFKAPEQYAPKEYSGFCPDIFAVGIMLSLFLSGVHPSGLTIKQIFKKNPKGGWKNWAEKGIRIVEVNDNLLNSLILKMLDSNPLNRPSNKEAFECILSKLKDIDINSAKQLELLFDYYNTIDTYKNESKRLSYMEKIFDLPNQASDIIKQLQYELDSQKNTINSPEKAVSLCNLCNTLGRLLFRKDKYYYKDKIEECGKIILSEISKWKTEIKSKHQYPALEFHGEILWDSLSKIPDFEVIAELIGYAINLLNNSIGEEETKKFFENKDDYIKSAYFYHIASELRVCNSLNIESYLTPLNKCIEINPNEAVFYYMRASWKLNCIIMNKKSMSQETKDSIMEDLRKAINLNPTWSEPKKCFDNLSVGG